MSVAAKACPAIDGKRPLNDRTSGNGAVTEPEPKKTAQQPTSVSRWTAMAYMVGDRGLEPLTSAV